MKSNALVAATLFIFALSACNSERVGSSNEQEVVEPTAEKEYNTETKGAIRGVNKEMQPLAVIPAEENSASFELVIAADKNKVWQVIKQFDLVGNYYTGILSATYADGANKPEVGVSRISESSMGGQLAERISKMEEGKTLVYSTTSANTPGNKLTGKWAFDVLDNVFELQSDGGGTKVTFSTTFRIKSNFQPTQAIVDHTARQFTWAAKEMLNGLKAYIESGKIQTAEEKINSLREFAKVDI